ncbi:hypothetical protein K501DRAFT_273863 [Backusella circina FSU 941]|nr:hypothetical protein K501DRAFT_273863 [Backusella circina FSU 941]
MSSVSKKRLSSSSKSNPLNTLPEALFDPIYQQQQQQQQQASVNIPVQPTAIYPPPSPALPSSDPSIQHSDFLFDASESNDIKDKPILSKKKHRKITKFHPHGFTFPKEESTLLPLKNDTKLESSYQPNIERCKYMTKGKGYYYNIIAYIASDKQYRDMLIETRQREKKKMEELAKNE